MNFIKLFKKSVFATLNKLVEKNILEIVAILKKVRNSKGRLFIIGVGGSAGNASHAVNDFRKLCNIDTYTPVDNVSEITSKTNDEGFDTIFDTYLKLSKFNKNDALMVFSVGGGNFKKKVSVNLIKAIKPHTLVKGGDYHGKKVAGQDLVNELKLVEFIEGKSSTKTIEKIKKGY